MQLSTLRKFYSYSLVLLITKFLLMLLTMSFTIAAIFFPYVQALKPNHLIHFAE